MSFTYKNKSDQELVIPGVGSVKPNETVTSEYKLENQHLEETGDNQSQQQQATTQPELQKPSQPPTTQTEPVKEEGK
jgi:hypothetical protein